MDVHEYQAKELFVSHGVPAPAGTVVTTVDDAVAAADAQIDVRLHRAGLDLRGPEPARYFFRVGPRGVDFFGRRIETTFEGEAWVDGGADGGGGGHESFST